jgi:hypothetical protein
MLTTILALATIGVGLWAGFIAPPSRGGALVLAGGALLCLLAAAGLYGWHWVTLVACAPAIAVPVTAARLAATKWSTPDIYDDE